MLDLMELNSVFLKRPYMAAAIGTPRVIPRFLAVARMAVPFLVFQLGYGS